MRRMPVSLAIGVMLLTGGCGSPTATPTQSESRQAGSPSVGSPSGAPATMPPGAIVDTAGWATYSPADGAFEIKMPGSPTEVSTKLSSSEWATPFTEVMVLNPGGKTGFSVGWVDYTAAALGGKSADTILARGQATQVARIKDGTIVDQRQIAIDGHPGRAWTVKFPGGAAQTRAFIVGVRLYTLQAVLADGDQARGSAYLDSFKLKS